MKIELKSIKIFNDDSVFSFSFSDKVCIFSRDNSQGKTTLVRFLIYALGYNIPITDKIVKENYKINLELNVGEERFTVFRHADVMVVKNADCKEYDFNVKHDNNEVIKLLFNIDNPNVQRNLLGCFYIDQERGWAVINSGRVLGQYMFNIEKFLGGLSETDESKKKMIKSIEKEIKLYKNVINLYKTNNKLSDYDKQIKSPDIALSEIQDEINSLILELNSHKAKLKSAEKAKKDNKEWTERIDSLKITVKHGDGEPFRLKKEDIVGIKESSEFTEAIIFDEKNKIFNLEKNIGDLKSKMDDLVRDAETVSKIKIAGVKECMKMDINSATSNLEILKKQKKILEDSIESEMPDVDWMAKSNEILAKFASILGVNSYLRGNNPIESKEIMISGTDKQKIVLAYRLTFLTLINDKYGIRLPIIIDTIDKETDEKNLNAIMSFIRNEFSEHQVFISTIRNVGSEYQIVELKGGLFNKKVQSQKFIEDF